MERGSQTTIWESPAAFRLRRTVSTRAAHGVGEGVGSAAARLRRRRLRRGESAEVARSVMKSSCLSFVPC